MLIGTCSFQLSQRATRSLFPRARYLRFPMLCLLVGKFLFFPLPSSKIRSPTQCDLLLVHSRLSRDLISGDRWTWSLSDYSNFSIMGMGLSWPQPWLLSHYTKYKWPWKAQAQSQGLVKGSCRNLLDALTMPAFASWAETRGFSPFAKETESSRTQWRRHRGL